MSDSSIYPTYRLIPGIVDELFPSDIQHMGEEKDNTMNSAGNGEDLQWIPIVFRSLFSDPPFFYKKQNKKNIKRSRPMIAYQMSAGPKQTDEGGHIAEELQDYEMRFRTMAEYVNLGMFQITPGDNSRVISVNHVLARMLGYDSPKEICGKPIRDLMIQSTDLDDIACDIRKGTSVVGREVRLKRKEGSEIWVSAQAWNLKAPGNPVIEGFIEDITENRVLEQEMHYHESELNRFALELAQANKKLNLLSSITRHDILNKLTGLQGYLELMKEGFPDPKIQEYLAIQETIIQTITLQIRFTKDYQDIGINTPQWFNVKKTLEKATATLTLSGITLAVETGDLWIYADPLLEKVFYNLVENAIRHGGKVTRITFSAEITDDGARIICEDDGSGVPERFKEAIFLRKHFKHTGFGLFLSREILEITGLTIQESGKPGHGARFEIIIPTANFRTGDSIIG
jgi:PAS domain S-box-containing protein